jgi:hypothetical protein
MLPALPRAGFCACLSLLALAASPALASSNDLVPTGSLNVDRNLVRAGTLSRLNWEINVPTTTPVDIEPDGTIVPKKKTKMRVRTLGVAFQSGNTLLPIAAYWSKNGGSWKSFFYDKGNKVDPTKVLVNKTVKKGDRINFGSRGRMNDWLPFHSTGNYDQYVTVLKDGDTPPDYAPAYNQGDIVSFMRPYIDASGKVNIGPRDVIVLFENSTSRPGSQYFDMQDIVLLVTFEDTENDDDDD